MSNGGHLGIAAVLVVTVCAASRAAESDEQLMVPPRTQDARAQALEWAARQKLTDRQAAGRIAAIWAIGDASLSARELFDKVIATLAAADAGAAELVAACDLQRPPAKPPEFNLPPERRADAFYRAHLELLYGQYLVQCGLYDEALPLLERLDPRDVVDPAACLFFRAVCEHQLLRREAGLATLTVLLDHTLEVPAGYLNVAKLMRYELERLDEKSLDVVARLMRDSRRRLELGRAGKQVQDVQADIVARLDEMIDRLEEQSQESASAGEQPNNQSPSPADESRVKGTTAPGEVDERVLGNRAGWGALPPQEEARAKNLINRNFPGHYRQAVEAYFKHLARKRAPEQRQP